MRKLYFLALSDAQTVNASYKVLWAPSYVKLGAVCVSCVARKVVWRALAVAVHVAAEAEVAVGLLVREVGALRIAVARVGLVIREVAEEVAAAVEGVVGVVVSGRVRALLSKQNTKSSVRSLASQTESWRGPHSNYSSVAAYVYYI